MDSIQNLINGLNENALSIVGMPHDEARISYPLRKNTVDSFDDFTRIIGDYSNYHQSFISGGKRLPTYEAISKAKELLEQHYRQQNGTIVSAFNDAYNGTNSGLRGILDIIADQFKMEHIRWYIREIFDQIVAPNSWDDKVEIIRQFIHYYGFQFSSAFDPNQIERYAANYQDLIQAYSHSLKHTSSIFRRL
jgi:hypothetical protein